jgi:hypothetical protein
MTNHKLSEILASLRPSGYELQVTTWENDGDNVQTKLMGGLEKEDIYFYIELVGHFKSNSSPNCLGLGNAEVDRDVLVPLIDGLLAKHTNISPKVKAFWTLDQEDEEAGTLEDSLLDYKFDLYIDNLSYTILGQSSYEYNFCRVLDHFKVKFVPAEVTITDVTAQFK